MRNSARSAAPIGLALSLLLAACGGQPAAPANESAVPENMSAPAPSAEALEAKAQVGRYFALIAADKFGDALDLWSPDSASRITAADLAREYARYAAYKVTPGDPTPITVQGSTAYVIVTVTAQVQRTGGAARTLTGQVYLKRPVAAAGKGQGESWKIWGVDIRQPK